MICWREASLTEECKSTMQRSSISILLSVCLAAEKISRNLTMTDDGALEIVVQRHVNDSFFVHSNYLKDSASPFPKHIVLPADHPVTSNPPATYPS